MGSAETGARSETAGQASPINEPLWWQAGVVYQVYPRSFMDGNGDGVGDLRGIIERLSYLDRTLGVDAVWLSPVYPSPMADFGYDVSNYVDIHPLFGDLATFDELVQDLHRRSMKLIVDFVPNHTSNQHPWFLESRSSRENPKRDWYIWGDGDPPNNWLSLFGGSAWEWDEETGQYYLHSFLKQQPDLNWRNPEVRTAMLDVLRFWLERGVDGFRIDVAHFIMKDPELRDNPPDPAYGGGGGYKAMGAYDAQLHLYDKGHPDVHDVFGEIRELLDAYSHERARMAMGEIHVFDLPEWASYYGTSFDELHMPFNFGLLKAPWNAQGVRQVVDSIESSLPDEAWPNYVLGNHDEPRIASRVGRAQARVAMMLLLTLRGTPTLYYGDDIAMVDVDVPPEKVQDPWGKNVPGFGLGRDPERTPMQWDGSLSAGFCPPDVQPWLPIADDYQTYNVATENADPMSMLSLTRRLLTMRRGSTALSLGSYRPVAVAPPDCFIYLRQAGDERLLIALNLSDQEQRFSLPDLTGNLVLSTHLDREGPADLADCTLRANEGCIFEVAEPKS